MTESIKKLSDSALVYTDDPTATYRGYRRQALYALYRLFEDTLPADFTIQPEGNEDLAVYDPTGILVEIVQVKDYSDNLTASTFKPTFYRRIARYCEPGSKVRVRIISFGQIGPELRQAVEGDANSIPARVLETLTKTRNTKQKQRDGTQNTISVPGLSTDEAKNILCHISIEQVDEVALTTSVTNQLQATVTSGDPTQAFNNLMWWLLTSSEKQTRLSRAKAVSTLEKIGRFLTHRAAHDHEWNISIIPIEPTDGSQLDIKKLRDVFFRGGRVRVDHISANLDVPRGRYLSQIHAAFDRENVVVIRAASGQGKTTIAYRYVLDSAPSAFRFEVLSAADLQHARRLAAAIAGHSEAISVPTLIYIDVRPGDNLWIEIVRELASVAGIRVLITIREEDWNRARITGSEFSFVDLSLEFDSDEARDLYKILVSGEIHTNYLDFDDAWAQFGDRKTLFEFVYFITQEEKLAERITAQIQSLQESANRGELGAGEVELLRLVAVASAYEARLKIAPLVTACNIPEPKRTLERFQNEYLLRTSDDGYFVEGFHSIRSEIISAQLTDPGTESWSKAARRCLPLLDEKDLESFLLFSFSRHGEAADAIVTGLATFCPKTWVGIRGVSVALMWHGLQKYSADNFELIETVRNSVNSGWQISLDWDLAQVSGSQGFNILEDLRHLFPNAAKAADAASEFRKNQTDKNAVFADVARWLGQIDNAPSQPENVGDFVASSELLYWIGHLRIETKLRECLTEELIDIGYDVLPAHLFAELVLAAQHCDNALYQGWLVKHGDDLIQKLREQSAIMALVEDSESLIAHYAIDLDRKASSLRPSVRDDGGSDVAINDLSVERVEVLCYSIPGKSYYGAMGYGHQTSLVASVADESINRMPVGNIIAPWLPQFNATARGIVERQFRPASWTDYFGTLRVIREQVLQVFDDLRKALQFVRPGRTGLDDMARWDECLRRLDGEFLLPISSVDEWGFVSESSRRKEVERRTTRYASVSRLDPFNKAVNEYTQTVGNFMRQALEALILVPLLQTAHNATEKASVLAKGKELGVRENSIRLSVVNGIDACAAVRNLQQLGSQFFGNSAVLGVSGDFLRRERDAFFDMMRSWCHFTFPNEASKKQRDNKGKPKQQRPGSKPKYSDLLSASRHRCDTALKKLRALGIEAYIYSDSISWNGNSALWIVSDTAHPLASLVSLEKIWFALSEAFAPDRDKIVRTKAIDLLWAKIIVVPLVGGKSLERHALPNFRAVTYADVVNLQEQMWRLFPEVVPSPTWDALDLPSWEPQLSWDVFDRFAAAYGLMFQHIDHMADFDRCEVDLDKQGEAIMQTYLDHETLRMQPLFQETLDACTTLLASLPEFDENVLQSRPNIPYCLHHVVEMKDAILPAPDFDTYVTLTIKQIVEWRNRLKAGLQNLGEARYLWIADSLGFAAYDYPNLT